MRFWREINMADRKEMIVFLSNHDRYHTMNSWNLSTSYANNMKIYNLGLEKVIEDKLWDMLNCGDVYDRIHCIINNFNAAHAYRYQAGWNGRPGGYLVLYQGDMKPDEYKSFCTACGQKNFTSVKETGKKCGRCGAEDRVDYKTTPMQIVTYPGKSMDMYEDFEDWSDDELAERTKLVLEFDQLCDDIVAEAVYLAENAVIEEQEYFILQTKKVLVM